MSSPIPISRPLPADGLSAAEDELDDLLDYDAGMDDPFSDTYKAPAKKDAAKEPAGKGKSGAGLGIDEEVEVTRKPRAPRVKLDENRLLSAAGIPKLRKRAKDHLKFKGKGHEYSDASKLLAFYQLWLDDLFPKARFLDALAMVEKTGHKRRMQVMRMEWINEGKPRLSVPENSLFDEASLPPRENEGTQKTATRVAPIFEKPAGERPRTPQPNAHADMDDLYDATPRPAGQAVVQVEPQNSIFGGGSEGASLFGPRKSEAIDDGTPEDDLDALLAEEEMMQAENKKAQPGSIANRFAAPQDDNFEDEMEAMAEMNDMW